MEKVISKSNKATLVAAALIITGATAIFGTYAASDDQTPANDRNPGPLGCYEMVNDLTDAERAKFDEAQTLMDSGDMEGARAIMEELGFKGPGARFENLTDEQKAVMEKARELFEAGDKEGAKALLDEAGIKPPRKRGFIHRERIENLTDEQKVKLEEAHTLIQNGDMEDAKAIFEELGLKGPGPRPGKNQPIETE